MSLRPHQQADPHSGNEEQRQDDGNQAEEHDREQQVDEREDSVEAIRGVVGEYAVGVDGHEAQGPRKGDPVDLSGRK